MSLSEVRNGLEGELFVAFGSLSAGQVWIGQTPTEAAGFMETHPECKVYRIDVTVRGSHRVELVPPVPATVRVAHIGGSIAALEE